MEHSIAQLLYRYQCVTVPDFGAFLTKNQSAQLVEGTSTFYPPKKVISFNAHLKNNDGLLANHLAGVEKISYEMAVKAIEETVLSWKSHLQETGNLSLKNIGDFSLNAEQNLCFRASDEMNYLSDSFGLSAFVSPYIKRDGIEKQTAIIDAPSFLIAPKESAKQSTSYGFLKYAAIFVVGLGLVGSVGYPLYMNQLESQELDLKAAVQKQVQNKIQEATFFIETPTLEVADVANGKLPYHIMAGAFRDEENAQQVLDQLCEKGYDAKRVDKNEHGLYPVIYGSYATYAEAEKVKNQIKATENPEAWILIQSL